MNRPALREALVLHRWGFLVAALGFAAVAVHDVRTLGLQPRTVSDAGLTLVLAIAAWRAWRGRG